MNKTEILNLKEYWKELIAQEKELKSEIWETKKEFDAIMAKRKSAKRDAEANVVAEKKVKLDKRFELIEMAKENHPFHMYGKAAGPAGNGISKYKSLSECVLLGFLACNRIIESRESGFELLKAKFRQANKESQEFNTPYIRRYKRQKMAGYLKNYYTDWSDSSEIGETEDRFGIRIKLQKYDFAEPTQE